MHVIERCSKISQSECFIVSPVYILSIGPGLVSKAPFQLIPLSRVINLLLIEIAQDCTGEIMAVSLFITAYGLCALLQCNTLEINATCRTITYNFQYAIITILTKCQENTWQARQKKSTEMSLWYKTVRKNLNLLKEKRTL